MIVILILAIAFCLYKLIKEFNAPPPPPPVHHETKWTCQVKDGDLEISITYEESLNPRVPSIQLALRCWALDLENPTVTSELLIDLNCLLRSFGDCLAHNATYFTTVPKVDPLPPTEAQKLDAQIVSSVESAMNRLAWVEQEKPAVAKLFLKGRTVGRLIEDIKDDEADGLEDMVKRKVNGLFHDPRRKR
jgi:hypothetical protein